MKSGIVALVFGYFLSQFYRTFLAVLTPSLEADIGATAADLSFSSGLWFLTFAALQIPVGWALDRFGPRRTAATMLAIGGIGGGAVFALAQGPAAISIAMALFGVAGAPVLMASYFIFARVYPRAMFATLAGAVIGFGSAGNLFASAPLAYAVELFGWRETMWSFGLAAAIVSGAIFLLVNDPEKTEQPKSQTGSVLSLLTDRRLLLIFPLMLVNYAPLAALRGLWAGPYFSDVFQFDQFGIGRATLMMAVAMILGSFAYGPAERFFGSKKRVILLGNSAVAALYLILWAVPDNSALVSISILTAAGLLGVSYPAIMAHGQMMMPPHLTGRGLTLLNLFSIGGAGLMQLVTSAMARSVDPATGITVDFYSGLFLLFGLSLAAGILIYAFSTETA